MLKKLENKNSVSFAEYAKINKVVGYKPGKNQSLILLLADNTYAMINVSKKVNKNDDPTKFNVLLDGAYDADWLVNRGGKPGEFTMLK